MARFRCHLSIVGFTAALLLAVALACAGVAPASAQGFGWFGKLFGGGAPRQSAAPAYPTYAAPAPTSPAEGPKPVRRAPRRRSAEAAQRDASRDRAPPKNASLFVYVFGDSLGQQLASGLDDALSDRPDVAVVRKARGSTGLVTTDYYDWPKAVADLLGTTESKHDAEKKPEAGHKAEADRKGDAKRAGSSETAAIDSKADKKSKSDKAKIDVAVMMVGVNDRQPIQIDGKTLQPGTPEWTAVYTKRVLQIDEAFRAKHIPLIWVGIPITRDDNFADDMAAFNEIYRDAAAKTGAVYVDTWEAFSDDNGDFAANGPDVDGQNARLRASDGVHFTRAGARKLAHFVDAHIRRALEGKTPAPELPTADGGPDAAKSKVVAVARPDIGAIRNLNEPPSTARGVLVSIDTSTASARGGLAAEAITRGQSLPALAGRADDARWSGKPPAQ